MNYPKKYDTEIFFDPHNRLDLHKVTKKEIVVVARKGDRLIRIPGDVQFTQLISKITVMTILRKLYSWLVGKKIGELRLIKKSPFIIDNVVDSDNSTFSLVITTKFRIGVEKWDGFYWIKKEDLEVTREELNEWIHSIQADRSV